MNRTGDFVDVGSRLDSNRKWIASVRAGFLDSPGGVLEVRQMSRTGDFVDLGSRLDSRLFVQVCKGL